MTADTKVDLSSVQDVLKAQLETVLQSALESQVDVTGENAIKLSEVSELVVRYWQQAKAGDEHAAQNLKHAQSMLEIIIARAKVQSAQRLQATVNGVLAAVARMGVTLIHAGMAAAKA